MQSHSFSPKARWDKSIPSSDHQINPLNLSQKIDVIVLFKNAKIIPRIFYWNQKAYKIKEINYNWQEHHGQETINLFSVATDTNHYQISFNNTSYGWRLDKVIE